MTLGLSSVPEDTRSRLCPVRQGARVPSMCEQGLSYAGQTQRGRIFLASCSRVSPARVYSLLAGFTFTQTGFCQPAFLMGIKGFHCGKIHAT